MSEERWTEAQLTVWFVCASVCAAAGQHLWAVLLFVWWAIVDHEVAKLRRKKSKTKPDLERG